MVPTPSSSTFHWMFALFYQKGNSYDSFLVTHLKVIQVWLTKKSDWCSQEISLWKCDPTPPSKMCHWMPTQLVPLWIFRFQTWGLLFKLRWRIWNKMFFVWLPWPALWLIKLLGVELETWWLLQPSESLNGSPVHHHCCLKGALRGLEVYRSRLCHLPLPLSRF